MCEYVLESRTCVRCLKELRLLGEVRRPPADALRLGESLRAKEGPDGLLRHNCGGGVAVVEAKRVTEGVEVRDAA